MSSARDNKRWCRSETCEREDLHEAHGEAPLRGRTPRSCPACLRALLSPYSCACGWTRDGKTASASPFVLCPACELFSAPRADCESCGGVGIVPRSRLPLLRQEDLN